MSSADSLIAYRLIHFSWGLALSEAKRGGRKSHFGALSWHLSLISIRYLRQRGELRKRGGRPAPVAQIACLHLLELFRSSDQEGEGRKKEGKKRRKKKRTAGHDAEHEVSLSMALLSR